ncbi:hypothetical protein ACHAXT_013086 [Thalassiosira profunda]
MQPSSAAARAAATAKQLQRRAKERARAKQTEEEPPTPKQPESAGRGGSRRYVIRDHGDARGNVFRKPSPPNSNGEGSILKRVTVGDKRGRGEEDGPSPAREAGDAAPPYQPHPPGAPPAVHPPAPYPYPPGPYGMPPPYAPPHHYPYYQPYPPPPAGEEGEPPADGEQPVPPPYYHPQGGPPGAPLGYPPYGAPPPHGHYPPPHGYYPPHPYGDPSRGPPAKKTAAKPAAPSSEERAEKPSISREQEAPQPPPSAPRSAQGTRKVLGGSTPLHVPRASTVDEEDLPLPYARGARGSVFRSTSQQDMSSATKILLSLSKSFEAAPRGEKSKAAEKAPESPPVPPRIQHWHKQSPSDAFEPQPSPSPLKTQGSIDPKMSFQLFNESFDANLEGLLGSNASFGFGPMKSLSFGLGLAGTFDNGENSRSPRYSPKYRIEGANSPTKAEGPQAPVLEEKPKSSVVVLTDARRVRSPPPGTDPSEARETRVRYADEVESTAQNGGITLKPKKKKAAHRPPRKIERPLLGAMERHAAAFRDFTFLLPGARAIFGEGKSHNGGTKKRSPPLTKKEEEVARGRVNAALCAFGGVPATPPGLELRPETRRYMDSIQDRYFEEENRLSWEIEDDPPVEASGSDAEGAVSGGGSPAGPKSGDAEKPPPVLARHMGVMVYPAVNAFTATEPGILAKALDEMNNFVDKAKGKAPEATPAKAPTESNGDAKKPLPSLVSPDSVVRLGADGKTPVRSVNFAGGAWMSEHQSPRKVSPGQRPEGPPTDLLFVDVQKLRPEQFRTVSKKKRKVSGDRYVYPALPLPYGQRKRISNAMFALSTSVPGLTDECAAVLGEARQMDAWDFAVAQLMTQVLVVTHCGEDDRTLEGLSKYLLTLGVAC